MEQIELWFFEWMEKRWDGLTTIEKSRHFPTAIDAQKAAVRNNARPYRILKEWVKVEQLTEVA